MSPSKNIFLSLVAIFFLSQTSLGFTADRQQAFVEEVLSGDTVRLKGGKTLKYTGVEAPPLQHRIPLVRTYGESAKAYNEQLVLHKKIWIDWGRRLRDRHNNLLGYVYLEDNTFVNLELLRAGQAKPNLYPPDLVFADLFHQTAWDAEKNRRGLWKEEPKNPYAKEAYVGEKNTKIYYLPNSSELERIPQANLVTFRSRVEATAAGYRACNTCKETTRYNSEPDTLY